MLRAPLTHRRGGKREFALEQQRVGTMALLVATPGRLLQHLEQTAGFETGNLLVLVLDEADRILDLGFEAQLKSLLSYLPKAEASSSSSSRSSYSASSVRQHRQTLLFSATQTKSVKALARLSMSRDAEYVSVHGLFQAKDRVTGDGGGDDRGKAAEDEGYDAGEGHSSSTPSQLAQHVMVCDIGEKMDCVFSFIKAHLKSKSIVFFATCAQVRFAYECFRSLQPGVPLLALHGKHKQAKRTATYLNFLSKPAAVLFATDIAARGLDFPSVDWVMQVSDPLRIPVFFLFHPSTHPSIIFPV